MFRKHNRKRQSAGSLINFEDFVRYRADKEKIITNPFQENWKKAIVFKELLDLYKPQESTYTPNTTPYDRKDFTAYYRHRNAHETEETGWDNNEDYQLKKFSRMAEGLESWDQLFQDHKIVKVAKQVETRGKQHSKQPADDRRQKQNHQVLHRKGKHNKAYFSRDNLKLFSNMIDMSDKPRNKFTLQRREIDRLKKKAVNNFGLNFMKEVEPAFSQINFDFEEFKKRQAEIYEKFLQSNNQDRLTFKEPQKEQEIVKPNHNLPCRFIPTFKSSCPVSPNRNSDVRTEQRSRKKIYLRIDI